MPKVSMKAVLRARAGMKMDLELRPESEHLLGQLSSGNGPGY